MSEKSTAGTDGPSVAVSSPSLAELLREVSARSKEEKRALLDRILRDLVGDRPEKEYALPNPDGSSYLFLVPPHLFRGSWETSEFFAEMDRQRTHPAAVKPNSEVLARLEAMQAKEP